ncbi:hypothetical protein THASP1DRAFT_32657 [Thamnocephalis sphaerospora]|uniref:G-protein coupled receptors family 1 profile domain-containing protein n=1 Tax=Thamnocephalis sphaerospora TaxID=78915 RepID=A0A4P9XII1_9FUNG|nr:hypothetical protein THASP1DRAFT_32657 [Thamnocephalis sphaerospora]|eukprot:RKP05507.1 hypothetical protein THASP1DRAFT_32657 [Thamnocephalis sphaerospora]
MKFAVPPPLDGECDWTVNLTDCIRENTHKSLAYGAIAFNSCVAVFAVYVLYARQRHRHAAALRTSTVTPVGRRLVIQPMDAMIIFFAIFMALRPVHLILCLLDVYRTLAARELSANIVLLCFYWALLIFAVGVTKTVLPVLRSRRRQKTCLSCAPSTASLYVAAVLLAFVGPTLVATFSYISGQYGDAGDWESYYSHQYFIWIGWGGSLIAVWLMCTYFCVVLTVLLRERTRRLRSDNAESGQTPQRSAGSSGHRTNRTSFTEYNSANGRTTVQESDEAELQLIKQLRHTMLTIVVTISSCAALAIVWAVMAEYLLVYPAFSFIMELLIQTLLWGCLISVILLRVHLSTRARAHASTIASNGLSTARTDENASVAGKDTQTYKPVLFLNDSYYDAAESGSVDGLRASIGPTGVSDLSAHGLHARHVHQEGGEAIELWPQPTPARG